MSAIAVKLLERCTAQGISLRPGEGFKLKVSPPPERLPEDLREELKRHKAEVLSLLTRPYINTRGELIIPLTCHRRFHWWNGGQSLVETLQELNAPSEVWRRYVAGYTEERQ